MGNWSFGLEQAADSWEYSNMKTKYIYALVAILAMLIGCSSVPPWRLLSLAHSQRSPSKCGRRSTPCT